MGRLSQCFTKEELEKLNDKQLEILADAILQEVRTNNTITDAIIEIVKTKYPDYYDKMKS
jgi:hypothetical protein